MNIEVIRNLRKPGYKKSAVQALVRLGRDNVDYTNILISMVDTDTEDVLTALETVIEYADQPRLYIIASKKSHLIKSKHYLQVSRIICRMAQTVNLRPHIEAITINCDEYFTADILWYLAETVNAFPSYETSVLMLLSCVVCSPKEEVVAAVFEVLKMIVTPKSSMILIQSYHISIETRMKCIIIESLIAHFKHSLYDMKCEMIKIFVHALNDESWNVQMQGLDALIYILRYKTHGIVGYLERKMRTTESFRRKIIKGFMRNRCIEMMPALKSLYENPETDPGSRDLAEHAYYVLSNREQ